MSNDMIALSRRAVACKGWRWMPGMRTVDAMRVIHDPDRWPDRPCAIREGGWIDTAPPRPLKDDLPDVTDAATLGCLLALVRAAWRDHIVAKFGNGWWELETDGARWDDATTQSFVEALVAALESAPG